MANKTEFGWFSAHRDRVYPLTIVAARYQGVYEGARYLAFPCSPAAIPPGWDDGDIECADWFDDHKASPIGRGDSPDEAHRNLYQILTKTTQVSDVR